MRQKGGHRQSLWDFAGLAVDFDLHNLAGLNHQPGLVFAGLNHQPGLVFAGLNHQPGPAAPAGVFFRARRLKRISPSPASEVAWTTSVAPPAAPAGIGNWMRA